MGWLLKRYRLCENLIVPELSTASSGVANTGIVNAAAANGGTGSPSNSGRVVVGCEEVEGDSGHGWG